MIRVYIKKRSNSQRENTPTVVYTTGGDRELNFRKLRLYNKKIIIDTSFKEVYNQTDGSFVIINPLDEKGLKGG